MLKVVLSSAAVFFFTCFAGATVLLTDSFDYTNGSLVTVSGGKWLHHSGGTDEVSVAAGRVLLTSSGGATEDVNALLSGQPYDEFGPTNIFYAGFTVRFTTQPTTAAGTYFAHFKDASASGFAGRVWALRDGAALGKFRIGLSSGSTISATNPTDLDLNTDYTVVMRFVNSNSVSKLWINPAAESDAAISTSEAPSTFVVTAFAFRQNSGLGALSIDDLRVGTSFTDVITNAPALQMPVILAPPQSQVVTQGGTVTFTVNASADPPPVYQWQFNGTNLPGATASSLTLSNVAFSQAGFYSVVISNVIDWIGSQPAILNVVVPGPAAFSLLNYNAHGNGVENWTTNSSRVRAIGRQVQYLNPDIITFQEIPVTNNGTARMLEFRNAYCDGYYIATNSKSDGFIQSVILSRFPIMASRSWLHGADLNPFGYANSDYTRDLFEAKIAVPGFPQPLHVFTVHLKSGQDTDDSNKRAAETGAISNYFAAGFLLTNSLRPYILTGDMNEDLRRPPASDPQSVERLTSAAVGLQLTTPFNPSNRSELTFSIQDVDGLSRRYDYILPSGLLYSNIVASQVFRSDLVIPLPPNLLSNDSRTASDHLPVLMLFGNPYDKPFRVLTIAHTNSSVKLTWESVPGQPYRVEASSNLVAWTTITSNLVATGPTCSFTTNALADPWFFRVHRVP